MGKVPAEGMSPAPAENTEMKKVMNRPEKEKENSPPAPPIEKKEKALKATVPVPVMCACVREGLSQGRHAGADRGAGDLLIWGGFCCQAQTLPDAEGGIGATIPKM